MGRTRAVFYGSGESNMFSIGDYIVYGGEGVCRVENIGPVPVAHMDQSKEYYTLTPLYHAGVIYAPTDTSVRMRAALNEREARALIHSIPGMPANYELPSAPKLVAAAYKSYLQTYDCVNLMHLIRMIYARREEAATLGRSFGQTDDRYFRRAKELLYGELALALDIPVDKVERTIERTIEENAG